MNRFWGNAAFWYAAEHEVPIYKIDTETGKSSEIWLSEAKNLLDKNPEVLIWCNVQETMVPVPFSQYVASAQFTLPDIVCPTPEFKHGQTVLWKRDWTRGRVSSVTLNSKMEFEYRVTFFGQSSEYPLPIPALVAVGETPLPQEKVFPVGTKVVYRERRRSGFFHHPGIILDYKYNQKEGCWEHLVGFKDSNQWVDGGLFPVESEESEEL